MGWGGVRDSLELGFTRTRVDSLIHLDAFGFALFRLVSLGFTGVHLDSFGLSWIQLGSLGCIGITLDSLGFIWVHFDSCGFTWIHLNSLGFALIRLDSLVFTRVHLELLGFTWEKGKLREPKGKRESPASQKGKRENAGTQNLTRISLGKGTARTHARHETKRFPGWTHPSNLRFKNSNFSSKK